MTKEQAIERLKAELEDYTPFIEKFDGAKSDCEALDMAIKSLEQQSSDCVSMEVYKQVAKERDVAIEQLKELGYELGEKIRTSDDCVSRAEVFEIMGNLMSIPYDFDRPITEKDVSESMDEIRVLPPVTPTQCIAAFRFSKEDLRDICNERIEIECTHGTCEYCNLWCRDKAIDGACYCSSFHTYTGYDFYCADFEGRE